MTNYNNTFEPARTLSPGGRIALVVVISMFAGYGGARIAQGLCRADAAPEIGRPLVAAETAPATIAVPATRAHCNDAERTLAWRDADADGFGDPQAPMRICPSEYGDGYYANDLDGDDADPLINPMMENMFRQARRTCVGSFDAMTGEFSTECVRATRQLDELIDAARYGH